MKVESLDSFTIDCPQAAMEIAYFHVEEQSPEKAESRIPQVAGQEWHGARPYPASKSIAHDDVITFPEPRHEQPQIRQVVTVIGVPHDDIATARRRDAIPERRPIASIADLNHTSSLRGRQLLRSIGRAVICDKHFSPDIGAGEVRHGFVDAGLDRLRFVEAG